MIATTVFTSRAKFDERLNERVLDLLGTALARIPDFLAAARAHGDRERLEKLRAALSRALVEFEGEDRE